MKPALVICVPRQEQEGGPGGTPGLLAGEDAYANSSGPRRDNGPESHGHLFPAVNHLADLDEDLFGGGRRAKPGGVQAGDVRRPLHGSGTGPEEPEVAARLTARADRRRGTDDGVLTRASITMLSIY